jgi:IclR family transcriptional regulator, acetate operon repressor
VTTTPSRRPAITLERAFDVLQLISQSKSQTLGVTEIAARLGLSKTVVQRLLVSLTRRDLAVQDATTRRYALGPGVLLLGVNYLEHADLRALARHELEALSAGYDETATLSIRVDDTRIYLDQVTPSREVVMSVRIGTRYPLYAGASSKAILAMLADAEISQCLDAAATSAAAGAVDLAARRTELASIRKRGYAVSFNERETGAGSVAAPLLDLRGNPVGAISLSGPVERIVPRVDELAPAVQASARRISALLGYRSTDDGA